MARKRDPVDPAESTRPSPEEIEARAREERERARRIAAEEGRELGFRTLPEPTAEDSTRRPGDPDFSPELTHVTMRRALAHIADGIVLTLIAVALFVAAAFVSKALAGALVIAAALGGQVVYFVLTQRHSGQSPGKHLAGIRVVDAEQNVPSTGALIRRSLPLLLEYLYRVALIAMLTSPYRQRLGDRWGGTYVIAD